MAAVDSTVQSLLIGDAMEHAPAVVIVVDDGGNYLAVNQYTCDLLGYSREELLALRPEDVTTGPWQERLTELQAAGQLDGETMLKRRDGSTVRVRSAAAETKVSGMSFWVSVSLVVA